MLRIKNEIKFLCKRRQELNKTLYSLHITISNNLGNAWEIMSQSITDEVKNEMKCKTIR
jgi:hypothetical protein